MTVIELGRDTEQYFASRPTSIAAPVIAVTLLGSGLVVTAIGAGMGTWAAAIVAASGVTQMVVAILVFTGRAARKPIVVPIIALAPFALWATLVPLDAISVLEIPLLPMLTAFVLALIAVAYPRIASTANLRPLPAMLALIATTAVVATVATMALAATPAGGLAVPHGEHGVIGHH